jgi:hypothetical protein
MVCLISPSYSIDTNIDAGKTQRTDKEQSQSIRKSQEQRESKGRKKTTTTTTGIDKQTQDVIRSVEDMRRNTEADVTLSLEMVFLDRISQMEQQGEGEFGKCRIVTRPKLPRDFGISAEVSPGVIDSIKAEYLSKAVQSNTYVTGITSEEDIRVYRNCLAFYGAVIGQAYIYLSSDLHSLGIKSNTKSIGYDDFVSLANTALQRALQSIKNATIKNTYNRIVTDTSPCRFAQSIENLHVQCGPVLLVIGPRPQMFVMGAAQWYGEKFAGYGGQWRVSKAWSYQSAVEALKTTSKYEKWANVVSKFAEELETKGKAKEAVAVRKKAWEIAKKGGQTVSPKNLLPNL